MGIKKWSWWCCWIFKEVTIMGAWPMGIPERRLRSHKQGGWRLPIHIVWRFPKWQKNPVNQNRPWVKSCLVVTYCKFKFDLLHLIRIKDLLDRQPKRVNISAELNKFEINCLVSSWIGIWVLRLVLIRLLKLVYLAKSI